MCPRVHAPNQLVKANETLGGVAGAVIRRLITPLFVGRQGAAGEAMLCGKGFNPVSGELGQGSVWQVNTAWKMNLHWRFRKTFFVVFI